MKKRSENWCQRKICIVILVLILQSSAKRASDYRPDEVVRCRWGSI